MGSRPGIPFPQAPHGRIFGRPSATGTPTAPNRFWPPGLALARALLDQILPTVEENSEVHGAVMPYRAWDLMELIRNRTRADVAATIGPVLHRGRTRGNPAGTTLASCSPVARSVPPDGPRRSPAPRTTPGECLSQTIFSSTGDQAAEAAADALSQGFPPSAVGEAISLAANQLILRDHGRTPRRVAESRWAASTATALAFTPATARTPGATSPESAATGIPSAFNPLGARRVAIDRTQQGGDFLHWDPLPVKWQLDRIRSNDPAELLQETEEAIGATFRPCGGPGCTGMESWGMHAASGVLI